MVYMDNVSNTNSPVGIRKPKGLLDLCFGIVCKPGNGTVEHGNLHEQIRDDTDSSRKDALGQPGAGRAIAWSEVHHAHVWEHGCGRKSGADRSGRMHQIV